MTIARRRWMDCLAWALLLLTLVAPLQPAASQESPAVSPDVAPAPVGGLSRLGTSSIGWATTYSGAPDLVAALEQDEATPTALAAGDMDRDGVPDLIVGLAHGTGGLLVVHRGNEASVYGNSFSLPPFLPEAQVVQVPIAPRFLGVGDWNNDGNLDLVAADLTDRALYLLPGGRWGDLGSAEAIALPGTVSALAAGEVNRRDGLADLVVAVTGPEGHRVLIFQGGDGALGEPPQVFAATNRVTDLAVGQLDDHAALDLVAAAGDELLIVPGHEPPSAARIRTIPLPFVVSGLAFVDLVPGAEHRKELALLAADGTVHVLEPSTATEMDAYAASDWEPAGTAAHLVPARISGLGPEDLVLVDEANHAARVLLPAAAAAGDGAADGPAWAQPLALEGEPLAVLPMRLNPDGLSDLVVLHTGSTQPQLILSEPANTFIVDSTADTADADLGDWVCSDTAGRCTLRAAIMQANASPGADAIEFDLGSGGTPISPGSQLPDILAPLAILGNTGGATRIEVSGNEIINGFVIKTGSCVVRNMVLNGFGAAIYAHLDGSGGNYVEGCFLGTDTTGTAADRNNAGVYLLTPDNTIGGTASVARNIISGNGTGVKIWIGTAHDNKVLGNYIGTDVTGTADLGNTNYGVEIDDAPNNTIGGTGYGARNLISGNNDKGVRIGSSGATGNLVQGNYIGTGPAGSESLGNYIGVLVANANDNTIGGTAARAGNVIAHSYSNYAGLLVEVGGGTGNRINRNVFFDSTRKAIEVATIGYGEDEQDANDADGGPNKGQNWPVIAAATVRGGHLQVSFSVDSHPANAAYPLRIEFFVADGTAYGAEGMTYLGSAQYAESEAQTVVLKNLPMETIPAAGAPIVATATDADGNSSEFSYPPVVSGAAPPIVVNSALDGADPDPGDGVCAAAGGGCTLRAAIETTNAQEGGGTITFNIPGGGVPTIQPQSALPTIVRPVVIDGTTQPGGKVQLDGTSAGYGASGLRISAGSSAVKGLVINRFRENGILLEGLGNNRVQGCWIGSSADGLSKLGNGHGILVDNSADNLIGGSSDAEANVILGNAGRGIVVKGGSATGNRIQGNYIGTNRSSTVSLGNGSTGVYVIEGSDNVIGGPGVGNVITSNGEHGVALVGSAVAGVPRITGNVVQGNYIGTDAHDRDCALLPTLGNAQTGIHVEAADESIIGGSGAGERNIIGCNGWTGVQLFYADNNLVQGNHIGVGSTGLEDRGNDGSGVRVEGSGNRIEDNIIAGAQAHGVWIDGEDSRANEVRGNRIGWSAAVQVRANSPHGILIKDAPGNRVEDNDICGNAEHGVRIEGRTASGNRLWGNRIGTDASSTSGLGNGGTGVFIKDAPRNVIGGTATSQRNVISGNHPVGIIIVGQTASYNQIIANYIGTNVAGDASLGQQNTGMVVDAPGNRIQGNVISGHSGTGVELTSPDATANLVEQNIIGASADGSSPVPNGAAGVYLDQGGNAVYNNRIWFNCRGIEDYSPTPNSISGNSIKNNTCSTGIACLGCSAQIVGNELLDDQGGDGIRCESGADPAIAANNIVGNAGYGLRNLDSLLTVGAEDNWWGATDGPGGQGAGSGDEVSDYVDYDPWHTSAFDLVAFAQSDPVYAARGVETTNPVWLQTWQAADDTVQVTVGDTQGWLSSPTSLVVELEGGLGASLPVRVTVPGGATLGAVDEVTVNAVSQSDPSATASASFTVIASLVSDLSVVKMVAIDPMPLGQTCSYQLVVRNEGPDAAHGVALTDTLPTELGYVSAVPTQGDCAKPGEQVLCALGTLSSGELLTITITIEPTVAGVFTNTVVVGATERDPAAFDNDHAVVHRVGWLVYLPLVLQQ